MVLASSMHSGHNLFGAPDRRHMAAAGPLQIRPIHLQISCSRDEPLQCEAGAFGVSTQQENIECYPALGSHLLQFVSWPLSMGLTWKYGLLMPLSNCSRLVHSSFVALYTWRKNTQRCGQGVRRSPDQGAVQGSWQ